MIVSRSADPEEAARPEIEVVRTSASLGLAAAWNIGIRRARGEIVIVMDTRVEPTGDVVSPLAAALEDRDVAIAGASGVRSSDLVRFEERGAGDAAAISGHLLAFRRADAAAAGPVDEAFRVHASWTSGGASCCAIVERACRLGAPSSWADCR